MTDGSSEVKLFVNELICDFASDAITLCWALVESEWSHLICFFIFCVIYTVYIQWVLVVNMVKLA